MSSSYLPDSELSRSLGNLTLQLQPHRRYVLLGRPAALVHPTISLPEDDLVDAIALLNNGADWLTSMRVGRDGRHGPGGGHIPA